MTARVFGALAFAAGISAFLWDGAEAAPALSRCGSALWFADSGGLTASGERNEAGALSAAHRSLPFGTEVRVDNLANGRSVVVRVNDRARFTGDRIISVSSAAADELDMKTEGKAKVRLTLLDDDNPSGDACGAVASYAEAGGDLPAEELTQPVDEPATTLAPVVVSYTESEIDQDTGAGVETEMTTAADAADEIMAERFEIAFQPESARDLPLKQALGAMTPRSFTSPPDAEPSLVEPASSEMFLFSHTGAASWPIFDGQPAIDAAPAAP